MSCVTDYTISCLNSYRKEKFCNRTVTFGTGCQGNTCNHKDVYDIVFSRRKNDTLTPLCKSKKCLRMTNDSIHKYGIKKLIAFELHSLSLFLGSKGKDKKDKKSKCCNIVPQLALSS